MIRCLLTGAQGFLARNISNKISNRYTILNFQKPMDSKNLISPVDIIIHCAAEIHNAENMLESNILLTHTLLQKALKDKCKKFIYIGTSSEYGRIRRAATETDRINPSTLYEATKGCGTLLTQAFSRQYDLPGIIIRPYTIYGPYEKEQKLIPTIYNAYLKKIPIKLVKNPVHDWTFVEDFVAGIEKLLDSEYIPGDIINFGTGVQTTNLNVLHTMEDILGEIIPFTEIETFRSYDSTFWKCDNRYAKAQYEICFNTNLRTGLEKYITWLKKSYV
jgi:nucleoside-diphosphate-sugar epimerase